ncbi:uncharacterized protein IL334_004618 [Kwoniella shivajii]|uniref:Pentatricopeptide repeat protein n=1 Tax=Kwoniella shivajii TaxID=564305 RepID=A0ABZ1D0U3_9TREE|nr:hypothetical protein IL334_004618 [Kwoniella shivajii]
MLSSARQACTRRLVSSLPPGLPAESSKQALLRATASSASASASATSSRSVRCVQSDSRRNIRDGNHNAHTSKKSRGISSGATSSAALALKSQDNNHHRNDNLSSRYSNDNDEYDRLHIRDQDQDQDQDPNSDQDDYGVWNGKENSTYSESDEYTSQPRSNRDSINDKPSPEWLDSWLLHTYDLSSLPPSPLPPLETFRGLIPSQPLLALLTLTRLSPSDYQYIKHAELKGLMHGCIKVLRSRPFIINRWNSDDMTKSLRILRAILYALPSAKASKDPYKGNYLRGKILSTFFELCLRLNQNRLFKSIYQERLRHQLSSSSSASSSSPSSIQHLRDGHVINFDVLALNLARTFQWKLLIELFDPEHFPDQLFTSEIIAFYMQAHFGIHQGSKIPRIFELYNKLKLNPTPESFNHLIQSFLETGNLPTARDIVKKANISGISDYSTQQLSILRGYRALGFDLDLEKRVLNDIETLGLPLQGRLLNALIRLRMESEDYKGAQGLLKKFNLEDWSTSKSTSEAEQEVNATKGVKPTSATAKLVFQLSSKTGDINTMKQVWTGMKITNRVDDDVIKILLRSLESLGLHEETYSILKKTTTSDETDSEWSLPENVKPGIQSLNFLLGSLARQNGLEGLEAGLQLFHERDVKPDDLTLKIVVDYIKSSTQHQPKELALLVNTIMRSSDVRPTQSLLDTIVADAIDAISRSNTMFRELEPPISGNTFSSTAGLIPSSKFQKLLEDILKYLESIDSRSSSRSLINRLRFDAMTSVKISNIPSARIVWNSLIQRGFKPDHRHIVALIRGYSDAGLMYQAQDLLLLARQVGIPINKSMLFTLLVGWGKLQRSREAKIVYDQIKLLDMDLDSESESYPAFGSSIHNDYTVGNPYSCGNGDDKRRKLEIITAMIQVYNKCGKYSESVLLCYTDLKELDIKLDRKAIVVVSQALRGFGDFKSCLDLLKQHGPSLDPITRRIVKGIRNYQRKVLGLNLSSSPSPSSSSASLILEGTLSTTKPQDQSALYTLIQQDDRPKTIKEIEKFKSDQEILSLAEKLLEDDDQSRPIEFRRWIRLNKMLRKRIKGALLGKRARHKNGDEVGDGVEGIIHEEGGNQRVRSRERRRIIRSIKRNNGIKKSLIGNVGKQALIFRKERRRWNRVTKSSTSNTSS